MKRLTVLGIIASLGLLVGSAAVIGSPAGPPGGLDVNVSTVYRFVGVSDDTTDGDTEGIIGMYSICQDTFGLKARMCTSEEFLQSPGIVVVASGSRAWIQPKFVAAYLEGSESKCVDYSGAIYSCDPSYNSCDQWRGSTGDRTGAGYWNSPGSGFRLSRLDCGNQYPVACCAPASQTQ